MKNMYPFYFVTLLLSLHSVVFYSQQRITSTIQSNQQTKIKSEQKPDWEKSVESVGDLNKHAKNSHKTETVFSRLAQQGLLSIPLNTLQTTTSSTKNAPPGDRVNTDSRALSYAFGTQMNIVDALNAQLSESATKISSQNIFTPSKETKEGITEIIDEDDEEKDDSNLWARKNLQRIMHNTVQKQRSLSK